MGRALADIVASGTRRAAQVLGGLAASAEERAPRLKDVAVRGTSLAIDGVTVVGRWLTRNGRAGSIVDESSRERATGLAETVGRAAAGAVAAGARATGSGARAVARNSKEVGAAVTGIVDGAVEVASGVYSSVSVTDRDFEQLKSEIRDLASRFPDTHSRWRTTARAKVPQLGKREAVAEVLTIGGFSLAALSIAENVPERVQLAYEMAYPDESQLMTLPQKIASLDTAQALTGFRSALQGKLVEVEYVNWLNDGNLPDGHIAELAQAANNPGWDIRVVDAEGAVQQLLNPKDTPDVGYVLEGINKYADVDFVTWPSVQTELALRGYAEQVHALPLEQADIVAAVDAAFDASSVSDVLAGSVFGIAAAALFAFTRENASSIEKANDFGGQLGRSKAAAAAGAGAVALTGVGAIGIAAAVGARLVGHWGTVKRRRYEALVSLRDAMRAATTRREQEIRRLSGPSAIQLPAL